MEGERTGMKAKSLAIIGSQKTSSKTDTRSDKSVTQKHEGKSKS